jgi:two-component system NtrC family sensor kinase
VPEIESRDLFALILEDQDADFELVVRELRRAGFTAHGERIETEVEYLAKLQEKPDIILADYSLPAFNALRALELLGELSLDIPFIVLTGFVSEDVVVECMKRGAADYLLKDRLTRLGPAVKRALEDRELQQQKRSMEAARLTIQEENRRIIEELKTKEIEMLRAQAGREAVEVRAALAEQLVRTNQELEKANRKLRDTQAQLIQTEKMASLGQLVAGIAHEINNPMTFIANNLFTATSGLGRIAPEVEPALSEISYAKFQKIRLRLAEMKEGVNRVTELVLSLRTFSRLDEGDFKSVDVGKSIDSVLLCLNHRLEGRIAIIKLFGPDRMLYCSGGKLNQVFMNLISNAIEAIPESGQIVITTDQNDDAFTVSVRDTGNGIPEVIRNRIFDPFFTTKRVGEGTGLGLAISYRIVQDHHGSIEVRSEEGVGSEFIVNIPRDLEARGWAIAQSSNETTEIGIH